MLAALLLLALRPTGLERYLGQDLTKLDPKGLAAFHATFKKLTGEDLHESAWWPYEPEWVRKHKAGKIHWQFVAVFRCFDVPGASSFVTFGFDKDWKVVAKSGGTTGYRLFIRDAVLEKVAGFVNPLWRVRVESAGPFFVGEDGKNIPAFHPETGIIQWYAFDAQGAHLVRMTTGGGVMLSNSFRSGFGIGPDVMGKPAVKWKADLLSEDPLRQLDCLQWLSAEHLNARDWRREGFAREKVEDSNSYESLRADLAVKARVDELCASKVLWISDQATFARMNLSRPLTPVEDPPW